MLRDELLTVLEEKISNSILSNIPCALKVEASEFRLKISEVSNALCLLCIVHIIHDISAQFKPIFSHLAWLGYTFTDIVYAI